MQNAQERDNILNTKGDDKAISQKQASSKQLSNISQHSVINGTPQLRAHSITLQLQQQQQPPQGRPISSFNVTPSAVGQQQFPSSSLHAQSVGQGPPGYPSSSAQASLNNSPSRAPPQIGTRPPPQLNPGTALIRRQQFPPLVAPITPGHHPPLMTESSFNARIAPRMPIHNEQQPHLNAPTITTASLPILMGPNPNNLNLPGPKVTSNLSGVKETNAVKRNHASLVSTGHLTYISIVYEISIASHFLL